MTHSRFITVALLALVLTLLPRTASSQLIVPDQQYRCPKEGSTSPQCKEGNKKLPAFVPHPEAGYTINFVEIKDDGDFWDKRQLADTLTQIGDARQNGAKKPVVFVYIHGWQNNANDVTNKPGETDCLKLHGDVAKFETCGVARLAATFAGDGTRPVVGIYLAWRGLSSTIEPVKHFVSYWPRRNKARLVGRKGMYTALDAIVKKVGEHRDDYMLVMVGHSFGSRVLEYAAEAVDSGKEHCGFMERFRQRISGMPEPACVQAAPSAAGAKPLVDDKLPVNARPPVDLIVYVNAATSHRMTYKTLKDWKRICANQQTNMNPVCRADPMYLATSSRTDFATSFLLPVANTIAPAFRADRLHIISAANTPWLHTHRDPKKLDKDENCPAYLPPDSFCFEGPDDNHKQDGPKAIYYVQAHAGNPQHRFWTFNTGHRLIRNHGDVWNKRVFNLIMAVLERRIAQNQAAAVPPAAEEATAD